MNLNFEILILKKLKKQSKLCLNVAALKHSKYKKASQNHSAFK